jgi:hypothetical protein
VLVKLDIVTVRRETNHVDVLQLVAFDAKLHRPAEVNNRSGDIYSVLATSCSGPCEPLPQTPAPCHRHSGTRWRCSPNCCAAPDARPSIGASPAADGSSYGRRRVGPEQLVRDAESAAH